MKIATFNVNSLRKRLPIVLDWLAQQKPDVLCLQETKVQDSEFPLLALAESGYDITYRGMKSYNGVAILSREKPEAVAYGFDDGGESEDARLLRVVIKGIPIVNTYVPQGFEIDSPKYQYKLGWYDRLRKYFEKHLSPNKPAIWCGDMNVAPRPMDVHSPEKHLKHVCYHEDARRAYETHAGVGISGRVRETLPMTGNNIRFGIIGRRARWKRIKAGASTIFWRRPRWRSTVSG